MVGKTIDEIRKARGITDTSALDEAFRNIQLELPLAAIREASGLTQVEMAKRLGRTQAAVSKFEGRGDFLCSTLFRYARAVGAGIDLKISLQGREFNLVAKDHGEDTFFALSECLVGAEKKEVRQSNVLYLKDIARIRAQRNKQALGKAGWLDFFSSNHVEYVTEALNQTASNYEDKSATA